MMYPVNSPPRFPNSEGRPTDEERYHLGRGNTLAQGDAIMHACKAGPDGRDHNLYHIPTIDSLDRKPEHRQDDSGDDSHYTTHISPHPQPSPPSHHLPTKTMESKAAKNLP